LRFVEKRSSYTLTQLLEVLVRYPKALRLRFLQHLKRHKRAGAVAQALIEQEPEAIPALLGFTTQAFVENLVLLKQYRQDSSVFVAAAARSIFAPTSNL
jgi:hypothetical protein